MSTSTCFTVFETCVESIRSNTLLRKESVHDKEFHFQNWCGERIVEAGYNCDDTSRNKYPDYTLVDFPEGYEIKGLEYPGRETNFDSNSNVPTGLHNGRTIFYVFWRYPKSPGDLEFPLVDLVICHGDFLNAAHDYVHKNLHVDGFGTYGDIMIRDRKMYVVPTPFHLLKGTTGVPTLIVPDTYEAPDGFVKVGDVIRREADELVVGYSFDLTQNILTSENIPNPHAGLEHHFVAWRCEGQPLTQVTLNN